MKFPNNIILDFNTNVKVTKRYWIIRYLLNENFSYNFSHKFLWHRTDLTDKKLFAKQKKFTLRYSKTVINKKETKISNDFVSKVLGVNPKIQTRIKHSRFLNREIFDFLNHSDKSFNAKLLQRLLIKYIRKAHPQRYATNKVNALFDINFLRKEKIYTKLKYSRVPQYDAVSGGSAAILAGFLGYLITEKFGLELLDSGDFWFVFMYGVFSTFCFYPLLRIVTKAELNWSSLSPKWGYFFYSQIVKLLLNWSHKLAHWFIAYLRFVLTSLKK